jgi:hypothetical protein
MATIEQLAFFVSAGNASFNKVKTRGQENKKGIGCSKHKQAYPLFYFPAFGAIPEGTSLPHARPSRCYEPRENQRANA